MVALSYSLHEPSRESAMDDERYTGDFKATPYWWDQVERADSAPASLPPKADVLVIGSGYSGLNAALETARAGRQTVVIEAQAIGWGASTRNGGQVSTSIKPSFADLTSRYGKENALRIIREGRDSLAWLKAFVKRERIDCDLNTVGRFHGAHNRKQYELLAKRIASEPKGLETGGFIVPPSEQSAELGSAAYFGGAVYPRHASVHPAKLHRGILDLVTAAGGEVIHRCPARAIRAERGGFEVETALGRIRSRDVIVATNGYTGRIAAWQRRRIIPIGSYIIATEPISAELMQRLMPKNRTVGDTRRVVYYYRASPDRARILFGGRVSLSETDPRRSAPMLHAELSRIFPELRRVKVSHSWMGFVGYTFDHLPHIGKYNGIHYVMGYCGSGVAMAGYLGMRAGQRVMGNAAGATAFDDIAFPSRPFYFGRPWFLAPAITYYRQLDRLNR